LLIGKSLLNVACTFKWDAAKAYIG
jgi:hypothetical protein